jgi:SAM-dependent methyltransferase
MTDPRFPSIHRVIDVVEDRIRSRPSDGVLSSDIVEALDVVNHSLSFAHHPRALALWRDVLWQRHVAPEVRRAIFEMFAHLQSALARGETAAASEICDCLSTFLSPQIELGTMPTECVSIPAPTHVTQLLLDERGANVDLVWLELHKGLHVLDVGCGTGAITRQIARAVAPGRVLGIDISPEQLSFAARQAAAEGIANVDFAVGDAGDPNLPACSFDRVVSHTVLMYLRDPIRALARQRDILQPEGLVIALSEGDWGTVAHYPQSAALDRAITALRELIRRSGGDPEIGRKLPSLFHGAGLQDVHVAEAVTNPVLTSGAELARHPWLAALPGILTQAADVGVLDRSEVQDLVLGIAQWAEQTGAVLVWPRAVRAKARR